MDIPKIIHYCWFGDKEIPEMERTCIESWSKLLPEYQIMFWNESAFDVNSIDYVKQAYEQKKYAFVSDYVRMYALYTYGGVYFDTDVEVISDITKYLENDVFIGFENKTMIGTGIIGAKKGSKILEQMLDYYKNRSFIDKNGNIDTTTNVQILTDMLLKIGFEKQNREQELSGIHVYERDIFCPKKMDDGTFRTTERTVTIHHFSGSWLTDKEKKRGTNVIWRNLCRPILKKIREMLERILGRNRTKKIEAKFRNILR